MRFASWITWYKKPEYRDIKEYSRAVGSGKRQLSPDGRGKTSVPSRLKLERVLENKTCSPMSLYDFYMYLKYIEFSPENLEFYIWYKNYAATYAKTIMVEKDSGSFHSRSDSTSSVDRTGEKPPTIQVTGFSCDPEVAEETLTRITQLISSEAMCTATKCGPTMGERVKSFIATPDSPVPVPPCSITSPYLSGVNTGLRAELNAVIKTFLLPGSEKELNIPPALRDEALASLQMSSDPYHLKPIADHVYGLLRNCSHRNFVRLGVSNGTYETVCVATGLGIALTIAGFLCVLLRAFVPHVGAHTRWDAFASWPMWWLGMSLILSGLRGSCFFLLLFSRRQPLPWERFDDSASVLSQRTGIMKVVSRLMIFDRKLKVKDVHLRRLQHKIVLQSLLFGALFASICVLLFIFLPVWTQTIEY